MKRTQSLNGTHSKKLDYIHYCSTTRGTYFRPPPLGSSRESSRAAKEGRGGPEVRTTRQSRLNGPRHPPWARPAISRGIGASQHVAADSFSSTSEQTDPPYHVCGVVVVVVVDTVVYNVALLSQSGALQNFSSTVNSSQHVRSCSIYTRKFLFQCSAFTITGIQLPRKDARIHGSFQRLWQTDAES